jgi:tRNA U34 5-methylaminomethyl-2-thiouridine-forming methyltransferase MnmC
MKRFITQDGSVTFYSEEYDEHYHTKSGAVEEAFKKFAEPCNVKEKAKQDNIIILDVCFGLGYNTAAAIDLALEANPNCEIEIFALENDQRIIDKIKEVAPNFKSYQILKKIIIENKNIPNVKLNLLLGDARQTIKQVDKQVDAVFLDPFSPPKCPELWTEEFFKDIAKVMKKDAILATYSCARKVRDNLRAAGLEVKDGPVVGRRSPSTIAYWSTK